MTPQPITTRRMPIHPEIHPMKIPPSPDPIYVSATAKAGPDREVPSSAAIGFIATTVTRGAPQDTVRIVRATAATTQELRLSMLRGIKCLQDKSRDAAVILGDHYDTCQAESDTLGGRSGGTSIAVRPTKGNFRMSDGIALIAAV
jgi:hypothetical protein